MNQTTYRSRVPSPIQPRMHPVKLMRQRAMDTQNADHPIRKEIRQLCGTYQFTATFSEDTAALAPFPHVPALIAVQCLLHKDGKPVGKGHGSAILTRINKSIERTAFICLNAAFLSATNNACKVLDSLRLDSMDERISSGKMLGEAYRAKESDGSDPATDKQRDYLRQLVQINCDDEERERWESQLSEITKSEASKAIESFKR